MENLGSRGLGSGGFGEVGWKRLGAGVRNEGLGVLGTGDWEGWSRGSWGQGG